MPRPDPARRAGHYRQPPLNHSDDVRVFEADGDLPVKVYAAPGYTVFIERMCHGDYQQVPVDPTEIDSLIDALRRAQARVEGSASRA